MIQIPGCYTRFIDNDLRHGNVRINGLYGQLLVMVLEYKILYRKQHRINQVNESFDVKCCGFKVFKYITDCTFISN